MRLMASVLDGLSGCRERHSSIDRRKSAVTRIWNVRLCTSGLPVPGGRPGRRFDFFNVKSALTIRRNDK